MTNQDILDFYESGDKTHQIIREDKGNSTYIYRLVPLGEEVRQKKIWREDLDLWESKIYKRFYSYYIYSICRDGNLKCFKRFFRIWK